MSARRPNINLQSYLKLAAIWQPWLSHADDAREPYANIEEPKMAYIILNHPK
jgi:hypothetical protein